MAKSGIEIVNPQSGQRSRFLQTSADTGGKLFRMESFHTPGGDAESEHVHPFQASSCTVLEGAMRFTLNGAVRDVGPGECIDIPANAPHSFQNIGEQEAHAIMEFRPALTIEDFFDTYFALVRDGKVNDEGMPNVFQLAVLMQAYDQDIRLTQPPRAIQKLLMWTLGPVGRLLGYRSTYMTTSESHSW